LEGGGGVAAKIEWKKEVPFERKRENHTDPLPKKGKVAEPEKHGSPGPIHNRGSKKGPF